MRRGRAEPSNAAKVPVSFATLEALREAQKLAGGLRLLVCSVTNRIRGSTTAEGTGQMESAREGLNLQANDLLNELRYLRFDVEELVRLNE